jgi:hypothetical protein
MTINLAPLLAQAQTEPTTGEVIFGWLIIFAIGWGLYKIFGKKDRYQVGQATWIRKVK